MATEQRFSNIVFPTGTGWSEPRLNYRYGMLACAPTDPLRETVDALRMKYDAAYAGSNPPFIVVSQPFARIPEPHEIESLRNTIQAVRPFQIRVGPAIPSPNSRQLCFDLWPQERLLDLREHIHATGLFRTDLKFTKNYIFHMKITETDRDIKEVDRMIKEVNERHPPVETACAELKWVVPYEDFAFGERMSFFLGQQVSKKI